MAKYFFEYDPKYTDLKLESALLVECEIIFKSKDEYDVTFGIVNQDTDTELDLATLEIRDRGIISARAWDPPRRKYDEAYHDYMNRLPEYDKYSEI